MVELYLYSPYELYGLYRASVPVQGWPLPLSVMQWKFNLLSCIIRHKRFNTATCWQFTYTISDPDSPLPSDHSTGLPQVSSDIMKTNPKSHGKSDWPSVWIKGLIAVRVKLIACAETSCNLELVPKLHRNVLSPSYWLHIPPKYW